MGGDEEACVSKIGFIIALVITALLALVAVAIAVSCWLMAYRRRPKSAGPLPHPAEFPGWQMQHNRCVSIILAQPPRPRIPELPDICDTSFKATIDPLIHTEYLLFCTIA